MSGTQTVTQFPKSSPADLVSGLSCTRCLQRGHRCPAYAFDAQEGPLCISCVDGAVCAPGKRLAKPQQPSLAANLTSVKSVTPTGEQAMTVKPETLARLCKCGCGDPVPPENRYAFIKGHMSKRPKNGAKTTKPAVKARTNGHATVVGANGNGKLATLRLSEPQLNQFLLGLPFEIKERLANDYLNQDIAQA